jgi:SAM-dependent methyltransferase
MISYVNTQYEKGHYSDYVMAREMKLDHFRWRMDRMRPYLKPGRLLDVGCSCGYFLEVAAGEGYEIAGLEFSSSAIATADVSVRPCIRQASVEELSQQQGSRYDAVTAFDLIEHLDQPRDFLAAVHSLLSPGGTLALSTPDVRHWLRYLMRSRWPMLQPMQHLTLFSAKSLRCALEAAGFEVALSEAAHKTVSFAYLIDQIRDLNPAVSAGLRTIGKVMPRSTMSRYHHINIGELLVIARKRG